MSPIIIFGFAGSTYVRTARLVCAEKGVPHHLSPLDFGAASHEGRHPFLKMPALEHEGTHLFETLAIVTYVDNLRRTPSLQPDAPAERAAMMQWMSAAIDYLYRDLVGALLAEAVPEDAPRTIERDLDVLEGALTTRRFLAGDAVSLADFFVFPMVDFAAQKDPRFRPGGRASLQRWLDTMSARASVATLPV